MHPIPAAWHCTKHVDARVRPEEKRQRGAHIKAIAAIEGAPRQSTRGLSHHEYECRSPPQCWTLLAKKLKVVTKAWCTVCFARLPKKWRTQLRGQKTHIRSPAQNLTASNSPKPRRQPAWVAAQLATKLSAVTWPYSHGACQPTTILKHHRSTCTEYKEKRADYWSRERGCQPAPYDPRVGLLRACGPGAPGLPSLACLAYAGSRPPAALVGRVGSRWQPLPTVSSAHMQSR